MTRPLIAACAALALGACVSTATVYAPVNPAATGVAARVGFSEYKIENNRYRVTFQGGPGASERLVTDYAFLRAAEITLRDGYDWFQVVDRTGEQTASGSSGPRLSIGGGTSSYGGRWGRASGIGVGVGTSFPLGGGSGAAYTRTIEIILGRGAKPANPDAYDARQVAQSLAPNNPVARY
ncbi:MAG TPA: hypothetical protein VF138_03560 [Caulobacteraceae bacterium]